MFAIASAYRYAGADKGTPLEWDMHVSNLSVLVLTPLRFSNKCGLEHRTGSVR